ncbi:MAG TPA: ATP-binding protein [Blastocatellia bacterium]
MNVLLAMEPLTDSRPRFRSTVKFMSLRTKLLLGYSIFVVAILALGGWSAWRLREMSGVTRQILSHNYDSVVAAQEMKETLERQDSAAVFFLLGQQERARAQLREFRQRFNAAFNKAAHNITEPGEAQLIEIIRRDRDEYYRRFDALPASITRSAVKGEYYFNELEPVFHLLRGRCDELLRMNQSAMLAKSDSAAKAAWRWFLITLALAGTLGAIGIVLAMLLARMIVRPVHELTTATAKLAGGNLDAKAEIISRDELGLLAVEFNRMAERIRQLRRSDLGKLLIARQTTEAAIDSLYDPVLVTDAGGRITKLNYAAADIFGTEAENIGRPIGEVTGDPRITTAVAEAINLRRAVANESLTLLPSLSIDGAERAYRPRTTPMRDEENHLLGAVTLLEDVTHLREIDRVKSEFIHTASRELSAPLRDLQMGVHVLLEEAAENLDEKLLDVLYACRTDCERLDKLVSDLLALSRLETGESKPRLARVNLTGLLRQLSDELRPLAEANAINFKSEVPFDLPAADIDQRQIERVVKTLVINAIEHTPRDGEIQISALPRPGYVTISVADTGCGIPAGYLPRIFDKFVKVPNSPSEGAGLGLAISKMLIEAHGGQISVRSEAGRGATFTLTLPARLTAPANAADTGLITVSK